MGDDLEVELIRGFLMAWLVLKSSPNSTDFSKWLRVQIPTVPLIVGSVTLPGLTFLICKIGMKK